MAFGKDADAEPPLGILLNAEEQFRPDGIAVLLLPRLRAAEEEAWIGETTLEVVSGASGENSRRPRRGFPNHSLGPAMKQWRWLGLRWFAPARRQM